MHLVVISKLSVLLMSKFYVMLPQDFRLRDISEYEEWYGQAHRAPDLQVGNSGLLGT